MKMTLPELRLLFNSMSSSDQDVFLDIVAQLIDYPTHTKIDMLRGWVKTAQEAAHVQPDYYAQDLTRKDV